MIRINPKPEPSSAVIRPFKDESLQSLLFRKRIAAIRGSKIVEVPSPPEITLPNIDNL